jgi:hypothetical protein
MDRAIRKESSRFITLSFFNVTDAAAAASLSAQGTICRSPGCEHGKLFPRIFENARGGLGGVLQPSENKGLWAFGVGAPKMAEVLLRRD